jgi:hypothetical protein
MKIAYCLLRNTIGNEDKKFEEEKKIATDANI